MIQKNNNNNIISPKNNGDLIPFKKRSYQEFNTMNTMNTNNNSTSDNQLTSRNNYFTPFNQFNTNYYLNMEPIKENAKYNNLNQTTINKETGLTLPITIINKPQLQPPPPPAVPSDRISSKKEDSTPVVPFKKRNFSKFLEEEDCSIIASIHPNQIKNDSVNFKTSVIKKSKEHLLDPNRQKKSNFFYFYFHHHYNLNFKYFKLNVVHTCGNFVQTC